MLTFQGWRFQVPLKNFLRGVVDQDCRSECPCECRCTRVGLYWLSGWSAGAPYSFLSMASSPSIPKAPLKASAKARWASLAAFPRQEPRQLLPRQGRKMRYRSVTSNLDVHRPRADHLFKDNGARNYARRAQLLISQCFTRNSLRPKRFLSNSR